LHRFATGDEGIPVVIDLRLIGAGDGERDRLGEVKRRPAVDRPKRLVVELEGDVDHRRIGVRSDVAVAIDMGHPGVGEHRKVELDGLLGIAVEPETRRDRLGHDLLLLHPRFLSALAIPMMYVHRTPVLLVAS
jgi:hypothetical protein